MKKIICIFVLLVMCFSIVSCGQSEVEIPDGMKQASEANDLFYLFIPASWTYSRGHNMPYAYVSESDTSNVSVVLYMLNEAEITTADTTAAETTEATSDAESSKVENPREPYIDQFWTEFTENAVLSYGESFNLIEKSEAVLDRLYAKQFIYSESTGGKEYKHLAVVTCYGGMIVCFTYTSTVDNYEAHLNEVNLMIKEFKFKQ